MPSKETDIVSAEADTVGSWGKTYQARGTIFELRMLRSRVTNGMGMSGSKLSIRVPANSGCENVAPDHDLIAEATDQIRVIAALWPLFAEARSRPCPKLCAEHHALSKQGDAQGCDEYGRAGNQSERRNAAHVGLRLPQHRAPVRRRRLGAHSEV